MEWFSAKGVVAGRPEELEMQHAGLQIRKVISSQEKAAKGVPGILERRLNRKLTVVL